MIDIEGGAEAGYFGGSHRAVQEQEDCGLPDDVNEHHFGLDGQEDKREAK